jgi:exopolysaccharide biosynthesis polyprenyl glycosylphosphotransferase
VPFPAPFNPEKPRVPVQQPDAIPPTQAAVPARKKLASAVSVGLDRGRLPQSPARAGWTVWRGRVAAEHGPRHGRRNILIVGAGPLGREIAAILEADRAECNVVGFVDESEVLTPDVLGRVDDLARIARREFVDEVIVTIPRQHDLSRRAVGEALRNRLDIRVIPDVYGLDGNRVEVEYLGEMPVLTLRAEKVAAWGLFWKRVLDITLSIAALAALAPFMAIIAAAIKLSSPGPALYQARRVGHKGRRFICHKFRTMVSDADQMKESLRGWNEREGPCFKIAADPRITRVGHFLRRYSLDELPQLWNVLRGEMSLVGPRPHPVDDFERYRLEHLQRLDVVPGITGLWQVTARRDPSFHRNLTLDLQYIEHWNLWLDLVILWKTVFVVLRGGGA